jgi:hypothetical protein
VKRDWRQAQSKKESEGCCRACGSTHNLEAAHIVPRSQVHASGGGEDPRNIIILCTRCHVAQHAGRLELLPILTYEEQGYVASLVGLTEAIRRTTRMAA